MADNEEAILKEAKKLPLEDRLAHKHWRARVQALEDIAVTCDKATDPKDPKLREYGMSHFPIARILLPTECSSSIGHQVSIPSQQMLRLACFGQGNRYVHSLVGQR